MHLKNYTAFSIEFLLLFFSFILSILSGPSGPIGGQGYTEGIIWDLRAPRALMAILVGGALALAGVIMQALFRNPLVDPYILGTSSGSALFAAIAAPSPLEPLFAFIGGLIATMSVYTITWRERTETLLLVGLATGTLLSSLMSLLLFVKASAFSSMLFWLFGGLGFATWQKSLLLCAVLILSVIFTLPFTMELDSLLIGEEKSQHLGVNIKRLRSFLLFIACLVTSVSVALTGIIGFVGLMIPHMCRRLVGPKHRVLIPFAILAGGIFLLLADIAARMLLVPNELPIGIITSLCGAPFFIYLVWRQRNVKHRWD